MSNSRMALMASEEKPHNSSKGKGLILETPYRPGFIDDSDLETVKMAVDKELDDISNAFYQTTEQTANTITRVDKIEIGTEELGAKIEELDKVSTENGEAFAQRITEISAQINDNTAMIRTESTARVNADEAIAQRIDSIVGAFGGELGPLFAEIDDNFKVLSKADEALAQRIETTKAEYEAADTLIKAEIVTETEARVTADKALASEITTVGTQLGNDIATVQQYATTEINKVDGKVDAQGNAINQINAKWGVSVNVNDKITGIQLNNDGKSTSFAVQADRFTISDGTSETTPPFEVVGPHTRIKSAYINTIQSDNWDGSNGWAITRDGWATFNNVTVRGHVEAYSGSFSGSLNVTSGGGGGRMEIRNDQLVVYDDAGRIRVILGRIS